MITTVLLNLCSLKSRNRFCEDESHDFLQLSQLISTVHNVDDAANANALFKRVNILYENRVVQQGSFKDPRTLMCIWDTGASSSLTPFRSDFIDYAKCNIPVKGVTKVNRVNGVETNVHKFKNTKETYIFLPCISYHLT